MGGSGLSSLASAVGGAGLASTHISYSNTGALLWYSVLVPRPYPLHVGNYGVAYVMVSVCVGVMVGGSSVMERRGMC